MEDEAKASADKKWGMILAICGTFLFALKSIFIN